MRRDQARHPLAVESRLRILLGIEVVRSTQSVLFAMDAEDDAVLLHGPENIAADEVVHRQAMLRIGGAMWRVVLASPQ